MSTSYMAPQSNFKLGLPSLELCRQSASLGRDQLNNALTSLHNSTFFGMRQPNVCYTVIASPYASCVCNPTRGNRRQREKCILLGCVDPDDIQVAVVDTLFVLVGIAGAALGPGLCLCGPRHLRTRGSPGARYPARARETLGVELMCEQSTKSTLDFQKQREWGEK